LPRPRPKRPKTAGEGTLTSSGIMCRENNVVLQRSLGHRDGAKRRATPGRWEKDAACSKEGMCSWGRGCVQPHRHCTPRLRSAHPQSSPNAQSLAERIAAPDPKVRVGRGLRASGRGRAKCEGSAREDGQKRRGLKGSLRAGAPKDLSYRNASEDQLHYEVNHHDYHQHAYYPAKGSTRHLSTSSACCVSAPPPG
jgi:hypothetical protein